MLHVLADFFRLLVAVQPHAQAAVAGLEYVGMVAPHLQRDDVVVAVGQLVKGRFLGQQMPGFVDDLVVLNDSLHRRVP
ncbi:hypothetical protein D3C86_2069480 [compost metagenome]